MAALSPENANAETCPTWCTTEKRYEGIDPETGRPVTPEDQFERHLSDAVQRDLSGGTLAVSVDLYVPLLEEFARERTLTLTLQGNMLQEGFADLTVQIEDLRAIAAALVELADAVGA